MKVTWLNYGYASGKMGGTVASRNRYGSYVRQRVIPVNVRSTRQVLIRSRMTGFSQLWNVSLTDNQRTAWNDYASQTKVMGRKLIPQNITGFCMFCRSNMAAKEAGVATLISDSPPNNGLAEKDPALSVAISAASQQLSVTFNNTLAWASEIGGYMLVYMGLPRNTKVNFFNGPWRYAGKISGAVTPPTSPATISCPLPVAVGQKVWVYARVLRLDGRLSEPFRSSALVAS
jgi:hypothetical protein